MEPDVEHSLAGLDDYLLSDYRGSDGKIVGLYVAYYASQRKGESPHSPIVCIPGGGWQIVRFDRTSYVYNGTNLPLGRVLIARNSVRELVYYWFDERGRQIANEYLAKWDLFADAIVMNRTDGALVRLVTQISSGETERDADERLRAFIRDAVPTLTAYLPGKVTTQAKSVPFELKSSRL
jgi:EpsI family protein